MTWLCLQDDPPSGELYDDSMETEEADLAILQHVASTTINLQDLEWHSGL